MEAEPTWHHFGGKINWFKRSNQKQKNLAGSRRAHELKNQDAS